MSTNNKSEELKPKQIEFLKLYNDPKSQTFGNAKQSAIQAGYSEEYADNITSLLPDWLSEALKKRKRMLAKAEDRLERLIDSEDERVAADVSKFIAKTQGKDEGYSERTEHTGKDGKDLTVKIVNYGNTDPAQV
jgi:hypothetical protein